MIIQLITYSIILWEAERRGTKLIGGWRYLRYGDTLSLRMIRRDVSRVFTGKNKSDSSIFSDEPKA